jgi:hypothetical protein
MNATYYDSYITKSKKTGKMIDMFIYTVSGTKAEIEQLKEAKGENYREHETTGEPLFYTPTYYGEVAILKITTNGNVVADTSLLRKAKSLLADNDFLADKLADRLLDQMGFGNTTNRVMKKVENISQEVENDEETPFKED